MTLNSLEPAHRHDFSAAHPAGERRTAIVLALTAITMLIEIIAGSRYGSMALLADGWHMATHVAAFAIALFAYRYARRHAANPAFTFGVGKVAVLGGFASAVALGVVACTMVAEAVQRLLHPEHIRFDEALAVAALGLLVNIVSALLLRDGAAGAPPVHAHAAGRHGGDHNLKAAYAHVVADALTSVLAIIALVGAKYLAWAWLDPAIGVVAAVVILRWALSLIRESAPLLLDAGIDAGYETAMRALLEGDGDTRVTDFHVWGVGGHHHIAVIAVATSAARDAAHYRKLLREFPQLSHVTIEVNRCDP